MAIVVANYTKSAGSAKANIRYIQNRPGKDGQRIVRTLFSSEGVAMKREEAYEIIDEAQRGSTFFRIKISPDAKTEDINRDLSIQEVVEKTMHDLEERLNKRVSWVAAVHQDHTPLRHAHILAVIRERLLPVQAMRQVATDSCLVQRQELDQIRDHQQKEQEREADQWERSQEKGGAWEM